MENIKKWPHILIFSKISKNISAKPAQAGAEYKKKYKIWPIFGSRGD